MLHVQLYSEVGCTDLLQCQSAGQHFFDGTSGTESEAISLSRAWQGVADQLAGSEVMVAPRMHSCGGDLVTIKGAG